MSTILLVSNSIANLNKIVRPKFEKNPIRSIIGGEQYKSNQINQRHPKFPKIWSKYYVFSSISNITYLGKMNNLVKIVFSV